MVPLPDWPHLVCRKCYRKFNKTAGNRCGCGGLLVEISYEGLDERFAPFYESGERVELVYDDETTERCYVGLSTGWAPCWLVIKNARSMGGLPIDAKRVIFIRPLGKYNRKG